MRLFIAIELPANVKRELSRMLKMLKSNSADGRFVPIENMHLTLNFLGESEDLGSIVKVMQDSVRGIEPFSLHLKDYNSKERGRGRLSYVEVGGDLSSLNSLFESLNSRLADIGFKSEHRRYMPHITLGRNVVHDEQTGNELKAITPPLNASFSVNKIILFESTRNEKGKPVYLPLHVEKLM